MAQKTITVVVPTYNEEKNVDLIYKRVRKVFDDHLPNYCLSMQFIDNCSTDQTRAHLERLCAEHEEVCAIFNAKNFGFSRSYYYGLTQAEGDCAVMIFADKQDPPEVIPQFVTAWEKGAKVVCGVRTESKEIHYKNGWIEREKSLKHTAHHAKSAHIEHLKVFV